MPDLATLHQTLQMLNGLNRELIVAFLFPVYAKNVAGRLDHCFLNQFS